MKQYTQLISVSQAASFIGVEVSTLLPWSRTNKFKGGYNYSASSKNKKLDLFLGDGKNDTER